MRKINVFLAVGLNTLLVASAVTAITFNGGFNVRADEVPPTTYTITLDKDNVPSTLTNSFQDNVEGVVTTDLGNSVTMNFVKAKRTANGFIELAPKGMIYSFGSVDGAVTGAFAVTANYTKIGTDVLRVRPSITDVPKSFTCDPYPLEPGVRKEIPACTYLSFVAGDQGNIIQSITIEYSCVPEDMDIRKMNGTYTGIGADDDTYSLAFSNGDVTLTSTDRATNIEVTGTASIAKTRTPSGYTVTCSFTSPAAYNGLVYQFEPCDEYHKLEFVSKSGTGSGDVPQIDLYRVYNVEAFQGYSETGQGWDHYGTGRTQYETSGARNAYVCEYRPANGFPEGQSPQYPGALCGSEWSQMLSSDYMIFGETQGRNGSKTVAFKNNTNEMRFFHMKAYFGMPSLLGRGTKLSFWARSPYSDKNLNTDSSVGGMFSVQLYYTEKVTDQTINQCTSREFYVPVGRDWEEYTMDIDESKNYYSFSITTKGTNGTDRYVPIDDITIYTDSPYTHYPWNNPGGNFHGHAQKSSNYGNKVCPIILALANDGSGIVRIDNTERKINTITYNKASNKISITTTTDTSYIGTITGTYDKSENTFINVGFSGTIKNEFANNVNNNITCALPDLHWSCNEDSMGLRDYFVRRYNQGGTTYSDLIWNEDKIVNDREHYISLGNAMKIRPYAGGGAGFALLHDFDTPQTLSSIDFWVYNPTNSSVHLRLFTYGAQRFNAAHEFASVDVPKGWSYHSIKFTAADIYNFQILDLNSAGTGSSGVALTYDDIAIHN